MKRRFSKLETNPASFVLMTKRLAALFSATSLLVFSATSCGLVEMRDATSEILTKEETAAPTLQQAERYSEVETKPLQKAETLAETKTETAVPETETRISLAAAGGVIIDEAICNDAASRAVEGKEFSFLTMYSSLYPLVHNADMAMATLHSPAADRDVYGLSTDVYTNMPAESLTALMELGFDVANAAGTGRLVCGAEALRSTIENVSESGMLQIGAYKDDIDAGDIRLMEKDGVVVAFVALTENKNTDTNGLVMYDLTDYAAVSSMITYADLVSDIVVVSVTWDNGTGSAIRAEQKAAAQTIAEAGADIIIGSDGSGLQTAEWLTTEDGTRTFTAYSLGNLMATGSDAAGVLGGLLTVDITADENGAVALDNVTIHPIVKHYEADMTGYQAVQFSQYSEELAAVHGSGSLSMDAMQSVINEIIPAEFLPRNDG